MFNATKEELIEFETKIHDLFEEGDLPFLTHLCGGNEDQLIEVFKDVEEGDYIFSTHRTHYHYLLAGGKPDVLEDKIKDGDSMFVFDQKLKFFSSSVLAGCTGIAAGVALSFKMQNKKNKVWCFIGDGAEDEGHFYEAVSLVEGWDLPCTFIVEDNDRSVDTSKKDRRGKDHPIKWPTCVRRYHYTPTYPHAGSDSGKWLKFNQDVLEDHKKKRDRTIFQLNTLSHLHDGVNIFFVKTDYLHHFFHEYQDYDKPITLITGNSDYPILDKMVDTAPSCITRWWGQAINTDSPIVSALPYGIENSVHCHLGEHLGYGHPGGAYKAIVTKTPPTRKPTKDVYANFSETTYKGRPRVAELCREADHITYDIQSVCTDRPYKAFVDNVLDHKMVVCPRGNAPAETHRFWEVLYLGRVPIVKYKKGIAPFLELPVIVLDDWDKLLDLEFLEAEYEKVKDNPTDMLDISYWVERVRDHG